MSRHGLRVSEACGLVLEQVVVESRILHVARLKGGLSTTHPLRGDEIRAIKAWLVERSRLKAPGRSFFLSERGAAHPFDGLRPGRCEARPGRTEPIRRGLSKKTQVRDDATKDLHDVHAVVDEMSNFQVSTDRFFVFPLQAETHMVSVQAGAREEID